MNALVNFNKARKQLILLMIGKIFDKMFWRQASSTLSVGNLRFFMT